MALIRNGENEQIQCFRCRGIGWRKSTLRQNVERKIQETEDVKDNKEDNTINCRVRESKSRGGGIIQLEIVGTIYILPK